ncbi:1-deoxy-D-xylulose-5-phosphate synthase [Hydrogenoanaerobacterium saccharovorans]|uniref:1-deoxy-D-xylulose-5-phosphate synthase n=1 Tax=Hydrogenoanaerobacterium saccharovorans TaxID=474960 RepID=A0A1H7ZNF0_9FIRM|nr:1-deoxy-D-xylulose-5-phosphate synthase [Hydrogenoanaerobacterium saccharovorans]RPF48494.1 1-deoxy-D-xylulose-5-phosphate synthase [Hydrogenoanaerobacterium saccharovorans]SEM59803.1 1-deoxy-D-xylulose-5-phosphate synthase [Hydrogenoanaerobacterium saccharovorans]
MRKQTLLDGIHSPYDVKKLNYVQMEQLCEEIRSNLIETVSQTGGHLASNLGVVEITVALHKVFSSPTDQIMWDVGHQAYTHKLLTGRRDRFNTLRQEGGISGFPKAEESIHDVFLAGHSSTSLSVASGLARAKTLLHEEGHVIAVIGDGSFTNGMVYEAMNNVGRYKDRIIVILNDNEMSISRNVGAFARYLAKIRSKREYFNAKDIIEKGIKLIPGIGNPLYKAAAASKAAIKDMLYNSNLFEVFGFNYLGPINGHDVKSLCEVMQRAKSLNRPVLLHVETQKGKGYPFAEKNPGAFHGVSKFNIETGNSDISPSDSYSTVFGETLTELAKKDDSICAITAAMKYGTGLSSFAATYPQRFFDIGIAEGHGVTFSAGLARNGLKPVFAVYSTFLQRGYDQILHDTAIEQQHVIFAVDRAGIVGEDGETHQGLFDAAYLSTVPNMTVYSPTTYAELRYFTRKALYECKGPVALRYPRGKEPVLPAHTSTEQDYILLDDNKADMLIITYGKEFEHVYQASQMLLNQNCSVALLKLNKINPIEEGCIELALKYNQILFVEEGILQGGIAEHFGLRLQQQGYRGSYHAKAVDGIFVPQATVASSLKKLGLDAEGICKTIFSLRR